MSEMSDKASGLANQAAGKMKQGVGDVTGSDKLKGEGAAQTAKGDLQKGLGDAKGAVKGAANKVAGAVDETVKRNG